MSSFFTLPASAKKRKRNEGGSTGPVTSKQKQARQSKTADRNSNAPRPKRPPRDESISGSETGDSGGEGFFSDGEGGSSASSEEGETGAERRLRLAEQYLENVRNEVEQIGFDAEEMDRDLIAERLKEDVAETKGRMYRFIAGNYDYARSSSAHFRMDTDCVTSITVCPPYAYTVSKDIQLTKWELPIPALQKGKRFKTGHQHGPPPRQRPKKLISTRGHSIKTKGSSKQHHTAPILCVVASPDGRFVATGGRDKKLIMWNAEDLTPLRTFFQHRDNITSLAVQPGLNRLYSASYDRTIKMWGLNEQAYVETLFGHQDHVVDIAALSQERCLSVGARDRTVRLWKVVEESQLVFRGGGSGEKKNKKGGEGERAYQEGSIERVVAIDDETFITGSDNGALALWSSLKKKPVFVLPRAHGLDPAPTPAEAFAEQDLTGREAPAPPQPRWITALAAVPLSDLVVSGSWDGVLRVWQVTADKKRLEAIGTIGDASSSAAAAAGAEKAASLDAAVAENEDIANSAVPNGVPDGTSAALVPLPNGESAEETPALLPARGVVNDLAIFERGARGGEGVCVVAALGREHRLGRWKRATGAAGKNGAVVFEIPPKMMGARSAGAGGGGGGGGKRRRKRKTTQKGMEAETPQEEEEDGED